MSFSIAKLLFLGGGNWRAWVIVASALGGFVPHVFFEFSHQLHKLHKQGPDAIDPRYLQARMLLPSEERELGYVSDVQQDTMIGQRLLFQARYALAPHLILATDDCRHVIVNVADPRQVESVCRSHGLRVESVFPGGLAIAAHGEER